MNSKQTCPICQAENWCQANDPTTSCWCTTFTFPDNLHESPQQLPEHLNRKLKNVPEQCICSTCAQKLGAVKNKRPQQLS